MTLRRTFHPVAARRRRKPSWSLPFLRFAPIFRRNLVAACLVSSHPSRSSFVEMNINNRCPIPIHYLDFMGIVSTEYNVATLSDRGNRAVSSYLHRRIHAIRWDSFLLFPFFSRIILRFNWHAIEILETRESYLHSA